MYIVNTSAPLSQQNYGYSIACGPLPVQPVVPIAPIVLRNIVI